LEGARGRSYSEGKGQNCNCLFNDGNEHVTTSNEVRKFVAAEMRQKGVDISVNNNIEKPEKPGDGVRRANLIDVYRSSFRTF